MRFQLLLMIMIIPLVSYSSQPIVKEVDDRMTKILTKIKEKDQATLADAATQRDKAKCARTLFYQCASLHYELVKNYQLAVQCNADWCQTIVADIFGQLKQYNIDVKEEWKVKSVDLLQSIPKNAQAYYVTVFDDREY